MPVLKKRTVLLAKNETTPGTGVALTSGTDGIINAYDVMVDADISYNERQSYGGFGRLAGVTGTQAGSLKFKVEAYGSGTSGTAPAWATVLLKACGMGVASGTFSPVSAAASQISATMGGYLDGELKKLIGAMGTWTFTGEDGKVGVFAFDFKGVWVPMTDTALATPQFTTVQPPHYQAATLTVGGTYPAPVSKVTIAMGNKVELREDITQSSGYIAAIITDRKVTGSLDPELTTVATYDIFGTWTAGTTASLVNTIGASGTGFTITCPAAQYDKVSQADRNGLVTSNANFVATQNGSTVDSEISIAF